MVNFNVLMGKTLTEIRGLEEDSEDVVFVCDDGTTYNMYHYQDCCENVRIIDVVGYVSDLIGSPIVRAEENSEADSSHDDYGTGTWTFYKLATRNGYVDIRWLGESNGYYSESVDFIEVTK